jgi:hypothetical protein
VVQEVDRHRDGAVHLTDVIDTIRSAIAEHYGIQAHSVVLVEHLSIPTTSSGKIRRGQCRQQFLNGDIAAMAQWQAPSAPDDLTKARTLDVAVTAAGILKIAMAHQQQASRQS